MTIVISRKVRIHYRFEGEKGAYLLLHHGLFGSHQDWYEAGYVDALRNDFRLIVMDARGHGRSDHPLEPAQYALGEFTEDVLAIMDELDIRNLHFCGYSLGALVGFELLLRHPERVRIVMLAGESPFFSESMRAEWRALAERIRTEGLGPVRERLVAERRLVATARPPEQEGEQQAALALLEALASEPIRADEGRLSVNSPVALFTGEDDPALERLRDARRRIHRARFVSFPGQSHAGLFHERNALVAEMLRLLRPGPRQGEGAPSQEPPRDDRSARGDRGGRERPRGEQEPAPVPAPLTPPPPVEVPAPGTAREENAPAAPAAPGQEPDAAGELAPAGLPLPEAGPQPEAASRPEAIQQPEAAQGPPPAAWEPQRAEMPPTEPPTLPAEPSAPYPEPPGAPEPPLAGPPLAEPPPEPAPERIAVRVRDEEPADPGSAPWDAGVDAEDWSELEALAPELPPREESGAARAEGDDEEEPWPEPDDEPPRP
jgi:pimeloyl-ACP methyl ester carboxylesterase